MFFGIRPTSVVRAPPSKRSPRAARSLRIKKRTLAAAPPRSPARRMIRARHRYPWEEGSAARPMSEQKLFAIPPRPDEPDPADAAARRGEIPLPNDIRSFMLTGIFALLVFYTLYLGKEVFLPIMFAVLLKL